MVTGRVGGRIAGRPAPGGGAERAGPRRPRRPVRHRRGGRRARAVELLELGAAGEDAAGDEFGPRSAGGGEQGRDQAPVRYEGPSAGHRAPARAWLTAWRPVTRARARTTSPATSIAPGRNRAPGDRPAPEAPRGAATQAQAPARKTAMAAQAARPIQVSKRSTRGDNPARRTTAAAPVTAPASASGLRAIQASSGAGNAASAAG